MNTFYLLVRGADVIINSILLITLLLRYFATYTYLIIMDAITYFINLVTSNNNDISKATHPFTIQR